MTYFDIPTLITAVEKEFNKYYPEHTLSIQRKTGAEWWMDQNFKCVIDGENTDICFSYDVAETLFGMQNTINPVKELTTLIIHEYTKALD